MATEKNTEARIKYLTDELHKANMEINRLVLENQEQDFEIHKLKKQRDELFDRLIVNGFHKCEYDGSEFLKDYIDKDAEELHKTATAIIFGSPEERKDASERAAMNDAAMIRQAMENARQEMAERVDILEGIFKNLEPSV